MALLDRFIKDLAEPALVVDDAGLILGVNAEAERLFGYSQLELTNQPVIKVIPETHLRLHPSHRENPLPHTVTREYCQGVRKDGSKVPLMITLSNYADSSDASVLILHDFTEEKRSEQELRDSESRYRTLVESMEEILIRVVIKPDHDELKFMGPQVRAVLGYEPSEFGADSRVWFQLVHPEDLPAMMRHHDATLRGDRPPIEQFRIRHKNGNYVWLEAKTVAVQEEGHIIGLQILLRDVTEHHKIEEYRRADEERYLSLFENAHDIVFTTDLGGRFTSINPAVERILGYSPESLLGKDGFRLFLEKDLPSVHELFETKVSGSDSWTNYPASMKTKDGRTVWLEMNTRLRYQEGKPAEVEGIARDITERRRLEEQLHQAKKMESVGRLAGEAAHDFNNLLTVILGYSQILLAELPAQDSKRFHAEAIQKTAERGAHATRQLLAFSRQSVSVDLNDVAGNVKSMLQWLIGENIELIIDVGPNLGSVKADPKQIEQVVMNLAINSRDAMPVGGTLTIQMKNMTIGPENRHEHNNVPFGHYVKISVSDTGTGMSEEAQTCLFEPFFTMKEIEMDTGLGLPAVFRIVQQSNGYIELSSELGHGTEFRIYLPRIISPSPSPKGAGSEAAG